MSDMPEGAESVMYLRDGWPDVVVCKVKMQTGHVGVGVYRSRGVKFSPENMDHLAMRDALANMGLRAPDYTELHEYLAKMKDAAEAAAAMKAAPNLKVPE